MKINFHMGLIAYVGIPMVVTFIWRLKLPFNRTRSVKTQSMITPNWNWKHHFTVDERTESFDEENWKMKVNIFTEDADGSKVKVEIY